MKEKLGQEDAFPCDNSSHHSKSGMSKRFYAACAAMQGILSNPNTPHNLRASHGENLSMEQADKSIIATSYRIADELLKQEQLNQNKNETNI